MEPLVSVIIPVYKVEEYINKCAESVMNQSYTNMEIILVDDGSPDKCGEICEVLASEDSRIKVIHKENGGLSSARNAGVDITKGEFICFIDSDDTIEKNMIETMLNTALKGEADVVQCGVAKVLENGYVDRILYNQDNIYDTKDKILKAYFLGEIAVTATNKLYRRELVKNIRMIEGRNNEDNMYSIEVLLKTKKLISVSNAFYKYLQRNNSIMKTSFSKKKMDAIYASKYVINMCEKYAKGYSDYARVDLCLICYYLYQDLVTSKINDKEEYKKIILEEFADNYNRVKNKEEFLKIPLKNRMKIYVFHKSRILSLATYRAYLVVRKIAQLFYYGRYTICKMMKRN